VFTFYEKLSPCFFIPIKIILCCYWYFISLGNKGNFTLKMHSDVLMFLSVLINHCYALVWGSRLAVNSGPHVRFCTFMLWHKQSGFQNLMFFLIWDDAYRILAKCFCTTLFVCVWVGGGGGKYKLSCRCAFLHPALDSLCELDSGYDESFLHV
jgi:hypothetical protein